MRGGGENFNLGDKSLYSESELGWGCVILGSRPSASLVVVSTHAGLTSSEILVHVQIEIFGGERQGVDKIGDSLSISYSFLRYCTNMWQYLSSLKNTKGTKIYLDEEYLC